MFKQAHVRGIQLALIQSGRAAYADGSDAIKVADFIASRVDFDPTNVTPEVTKKIAGHLLAASNELQKQGGFKAASFNKLSSWDEVHKLAGENALHLMEEAQKLAEGSTIEGGDKGNNEGESPAGETKMDAKQRPEGYATDSRGKTDVDVRPGQVGKEQEQPNKPAESPSKDNSVQEQSRTAADLGAIMRKIAEGSTIQGGDKGNKEMSSAEAKMDAAQRPEGYAVLPSQGALGQLMNQVKGPAVIGRETAQPNKPAESPSGSNSVQQHSAKAAEDQAYMTLFDKTAAAVVPHLPVNLSQNDKVAHVRVCMGLTDVEKAHYLVGLQQKHAAAPAAVPPGSRTDGYMQHSPEASHSRPGAYDGRKANQGKTAEDGSLPPFMMHDKDKDGDKDKDKDGDKDKSENPFAKKDDDKEKEAAMLDRIRSIETAMQASAQR